MFKPFIFIVFYSFISNLGKCQIQSIVIPIEQNAAIGYHDGYNNENLNYSGAIQLASYCIASSGLVGGVNINRGLIQYNLNAFFNLPNFEEVEFIYAELDVFNIPSIGSLTNGHFGNANNSKFLLINQAWNASTVTWNSQPNANENVFISLPQSTSNIQDYLALDATAVVSFWISNPTLNFGLKLKLDNEVVSNGLLFHSANSPDQAKHPVLRIYYKRSGIIYLQDEFCLNDTPVMVGFSPDGGILAGPGIIGNTFDPSIAGPGAHQITYTYFSANGTQNIITKDVFVHSTLPSAVISGMTTFCEGDSILLQAEGNDLNYLWSNGNTSATVYSNGGEIKLIVTDINGCKDSTTITLVPIPSPIADFTSDPLNFCMLGNSVSLTDLSTNINNIPLVGWLWNFGDSTMSNLQDPNHIYTSAGNYEIKFTVTNLYGCKDSIIFNYTVLDELKVPNVFSPNGDGINDYFEITNIDSYIENRLFIFNRWGQLIYETTNYKNNWNGNNYPSGTYFYVLELSESLILKGSLTIIK